MGTDQVPQGFLQFGLENLQSWSLQSLSRQSIPMLDFPNGEKVFPYVQSKPFLFQFMPIVSYHPATYGFKKPDSVLLITSSKTSFYSIWEEPQVLNLDMHYVLGWGGTEARLLSAGLWLDTSNSESPPKCSDSCCNSNLLKIINGFNRSYEPRAQGQVCMWPIVNISENNSSKASPKVWWYPFWYGWS